METCFAEAERLNSWQPPDSTAFNRAVPFLPPRSIRVHTQRKSPKSTPKPRSSNLSREEGRLKKQIPCFASFQEKGEFRLKNQVNLKLLFWFLFLYNIFISKFFKFNFFLLM